jgi:hypothetical protein
MTEGAGRAGRLRKVINARLEEMSFRSGAAVSAGAVVIGGTAIALGMMLTSGHAAVVPAAPSAHVTLRPALVPASAQASASPIDPPTVTPSGSSPALSYYPKPSPGSNVTPEATTTSPTPATSLTPRPIGSPHRTHRPVPGPTWYPPGWPGPPGLP